MKVEAAATLREQVFAVMVAAGRPLLTSDVAAGAKIEHLRATRLLNDLLTAGKIQRSKSGGPRARAGTKERTWRVKPNV